MEITEALYILKTHQEWRLGADIEPTTPRKLTKAINKAIEQLELIQKEKELLGK